MPRISIDIGSQELELYDDGGNLLKCYPISSAKKGVGEQNGSFCTPRGRHLIRAKIGAGQPLNTVFVERRPTGEVYSPELARSFPGRDWILTRILWLSGCEPGYNRLGEAWIPCDGPYTSMAARIPPRWASPAPTGASVCVTRTSLSCLTSCPSAPP